MLYRHQPFYPVSDQRRPKKADRVDRLLDQASKEDVKLVSAELVLAEVVWVLESYYQLEKARIAVMLRAILFTPGLEVLNGRVAEQSLQYYSNQNIDFVDAYIVALMKKKDIDGIYSFDKKHLDRITNISRIEP